jgi:putative endonuclease
LSRLSTGRGCRHAWGVALHHEQSCQWHALCRNHGHLPRRAWEHREGAIEGFTKKYGLKRLVYFEEHPTIFGARQRENNIEHWPRAWKVRLILEGNPGWADLYHLLI